MYGDQCGMLRMIVLNFTWSPSLPFGTFEVRCFQYVMEITNVKLGGM
jgi:hypothetical protein